MGGQDLTTQVNNLKMEIVSNYNKELMNYFFQDKDKMLKFMSGIVYSIQKVPALLSCSRDTLISAILELAQIGIAPSIRGQAYILPYKGKATAVIGYQGWVEILSEAGIQIVSAEIVRENDEFENIIGSEPKIVHKINPRFGKKERGEQIGAYVTVRIMANNQLMHKYMTMSDIYAFRDFSQSYKDEKNRVYSPWNEKNDPEGWMPKKTVLKQMIKLLPKNEKIDKAFEMDNEEAPINPQKEVTTGNEDDRKRAQDILNGMDSIPEADGVVDGEVQENEKEQNLSPNTQKDEGK